MLSALARHRPLTPYGVVAHVVARYSLFQAPVPVHHICKSVLLGSDTPDKTFIEHRCRISALAATECNPLSASWNTCFQVQKMGRNSANATCMCLEDDLDQVEKIDTVTILNELAHKLMSALVSEICFSLKCISSHGSCELHMRVGKKRESTWMCNCLYAYKRNYNPSIQSLHMHLKCSQNVWKAMVTTSRQAFLLVHISRKIFSLHQNCFPQSSSSIFMKRSKSQGLTFSECGGWWVFKSFPPPPPCQRILYSWPHGH